MTTPSYAQQGVTVDEEVRRTSREVNVDRGGGGGDLDCGGHLVEVLVELVMEYGRYEDSYSLKM